MYAAGVVYTLITFPCEIVPTGIGEPATASAPTRVYLFVLPIMR